MFLNKIIPLKYKFRETIMLYLNINVQVTVKAYLPFISLPLLSTSNIYKKGHFSLAQTLLKCSTLSGGHCF